MVEHPFRKRETIGLLVIDPNKSIHAGIEASHRQRMRDHDHRTGFSLVQAFATNDKRMATALKLIGYESLGVTVVTGIERFAYL